MAIRLKSNLAIKLSDEQLIKATLEGDNLAFNQLVQRHKGRVAATVYGILGDCPEAEDVGQEAFIRFYNSLESFRREASVPTYITRIAVNLSLNELKRRNRRAFISISSNETLKETIMTFENPDQKDMDVLLQKTINRLSPKYKAVLVLRLIDGYSVKETAEILKMPEGTVLSRLSRAQLKIREMLKPFIGDYDE